MNFIASNGVNQLAKGYFEGPRDEKKEVKTEKKKKDKTNDLNYLRIHLKVSILGTVTISSGSEFHRPITRTKNEL